MTALVYASPAIVAAVGAVLAAVGMPTRLLLLGGTGVALSFWVGMTANAWGRDPDYSNPALIVLWGVAAALLLASWSFGIVIGTAVRRRRIRPE